MFRFAHGPAEGSRSGAGATTGCSSGCVAPRRRCAPARFPRAGLTPLALGPVEIRNRIVSTSHQTSLVHDHLPTADLIAYHEARARGGVGLICVEATATHHTGLLTAHTIGGYLPEIVPVFQRLSDAVHAHGAKIMVQLFHGGREVISSPPRPAAVAPSSVPSPRFKSSRARCRAARSAR